MDEDGVPTLGVGFAIETGSSFNELITIQKVMQSTEAKVIAQAAQIERATGSMVNLGVAKAQITTFGNAASREMQSVARESARVEKAGERLVGQLDRQNAMFGKSRAEIQAMKVESAALAAEQAGLTELADRLRTGQAALAEQQRAAAEAAAREAQEVRAAAEAYRMFEAVAKQKAAAYREQQSREAAAAMQAESDAVARAAREHANLAAMVRESNAAQEADAAAAERLRMSTDPLYAATQRLNAEIAESTRLYYAGATAPAEYARQQEVLAGRLRDVQKQHELMNRSLMGIGTTGRLASHHMANLGYQFQDIGVQMFAASQSSAPLKMAFMALVQQGAQIQMIMSQAGVGIRAVAAAFLDMSKSILIATATNPYLLAGAAIIGAFAGAVKMLQNAANSGADMKKYAESLGLTAKEIRHLDNVTVTWGDTAKAVFQVTGRAIWDRIGPAVTGTWNTMKEWAAWIFSALKGASNFMIGAYVGAFNVITKTWRTFPAVIGDIFFTGVNAAIDATNMLIRRTVDGLNGFISAANLVLSKVGLELPTLSAAQIDRAKNDYAGAAAKLGQTAREELSKALGTDYLGDAARSFGGAVIDQAVKNAKDRIRGQAEKKGYLDPEKGKTDKHAERLEREAQAVEAQIRNLYALADAYKVSGAAALIAEARVKAESEAIKKRADIEAMVYRQIRLSIAQRVSDAAKATAGLREQADAQEAVNKAVAGGIIPAERAADMVKDQIADLPLLAAAQAAQQRGLKDEVTRATEALADQRAERERLRKAEIAAQFARDSATSADQIEMLRAELRLVGATNRERAIELATLKAIQEAKARAYDSAQTAAYVAAQREIAIVTEAIATAQRNLNDALSFTVDRWDAIANSVQAAGQGMADAFGRAGGALSGMASIYADYHATRARLDAEYQQKLREANGDAAAMARAQQMYALRTAGMQVQAYGDMVAAAKGFFREGSKGYKALEIAEKAFRAIQFANSLRAMAQDMAETVRSVANSGARAAAAGSEGIANQSKLPFPFNIAAMAATGAALIAAGIAVAGALGGGGKSQAPQSNSGTGTVLGDPAAQSESIKNAINALKEVDTLMLNYSRQMASSLRSIESNIGGFASVLARNADDINASGGITEGFKANAIGSILGNVPLIGGILKGLFGTKTTVIGSGLYGGSQSLGSILSGGFDAQYYSDIQKKKKLFGITTSTKYSTQYSNADPLLENQFTLILREFNKAILAAAGPLGAATGEIQQRLNSFVISLGRIDLQGLTGTQIQEKLNAVFGAAADNMARAAFPFIEQYQRAGEGAFETLIRVASTIEAVSGSLDLLGQSTQAMSIAAKLGLADQFESISALTSAADAYFQAFYTREEQATARTAQLSKVFESLGMTLPTTLAGYRALVEAQNLNTAAGQQAYAVLLQLAPAFAELQSLMEGAKSAADIASERQNLERQLLELRGDTAALRALQLAKLDQSNRALQEQIWALQDAQAAAKAADELRKAWQSVGDSIMDEVRRIRGLSDMSGGDSFAILLGRFNAMTAAARTGDIDAAKALPQLSQALLTAAANAATSRQELDRIRAQTAASLETTNGLIALLGGGASGTTAASILDAVAAASQPATAAISGGATANLAATVDDLVDEIAKLRAENNSGHAQTAANTGAIKRKLEDVTAASGGDAIATIDITSAAA